MKDLDRSKFTQAVLNAGRLAGAGEAELMDPGEDSKSILGFNQFGTFGGLICVVQAAWV